MGNDCTARIGGFWAQFNPQYFHYSLTRWIATGIATHLSHLQHFWLRSFEKRNKNKNKKQKKNKKQDKQTNNNNKLYNKHKKFTHHRWKQIMVFVIWPAKKEKENQKQTKNKNKQKTKNKNKNKQTNKQTKNTSQHDRPKMC